MLELAQAVSAISLALPHESRGRPSYLVRDEKIYNRIFNEKHHLNFFVRCIEIVGAVDEYLEGLESLRRADRSQIRFHLARVAVALAVASSKPKASAVLKVSIAELPDHLGVAYDWIVDERSKPSASLGIAENQTLAKSADFTKLIDAKLGQYSKRQHWPKKFHGGWAL